MQLHHAREAKTEVLKRVLSYEKPASEAEAVERFGRPVRAGFTFGTGPLRRPPADPRHGPKLRDFDPRTMIAVGIGSEKGAGGEHGLVVICQSSSAYDSAFVEDALRMGGSDAKKILIGPVRARSDVLAPPAPQAVVASERHRLRVGSSIAHREVTSGTLGCFVTRDGSHDVFVLSNNHVLANVNAGVPNDPILSPSKFDKGVEPGDRCGGLDRFVPLELGGSLANVVDCATATVAGYALEAALLSDPRTGAEIGMLQAAARKPEMALKVRKIGNASGYTEGEIVAVEVDGLHVAMGRSGFEQSAIFDDQILIARRQSRFSKDGDSGSLVFDEDGRPMGLVFSGSSGRFLASAFGAPGDTEYIGATFANPIDAVLSGLDCRIHVG